MKKKLLALAVVVGLAGLNAADSSAVQRIETTAQIGYIVSIFSPASDKLGMAGGALAGGMIGASLGPIGIGLGVAVGAV